jgi:Protein of unknown function (DUF2971)
MVCCAPELKLYKYYGYNGLKKTLENQSVKLSRASDFNDPLDMFLQEVLGIDEANFAEKLKVAFFDFIAGEMDYATLRDSPSRDKVVIMNQVLKANPETREKMREQIISTPIEEVYNLDEMRRANRDALDVLQAFFRNDGVFCSSIDGNNLLMWAHYAERHRGAVLELTPSVEKDSPLLSSKKITYSDVRPVLYRDPADMIRHGLAMSVSDSAREMYERLIYTKSLEWSYEKECRFHIPGFIPDNKEYAAFTFYPEELTAVYLGCRMKEEHKREVMELARAISPSI